MKTMIQVLVCSFLLLAALYIMLPLLIHWHAKQIGFSLWISLAFLNLIGQPILIGSCIHSYFTQKLTYPYWLTLLFIVNTMLFLLPILLICLIIFSDPINFQLS
jgi:hypothetical protein